MQSIKHRKHYVLTPASWHKDFPLNQFDFSSLIKHIEKESLIPDIIVDTDTGIEFYGADTVSKEILISILKNFNMLDNLAQNDSKQQYEKHTHLGVKSHRPICRHCRSAENTGHSGVLSLLTAPECLAWGCRSGCRSLLYGSPHLLPPQAPCPGKTTMLPGSLPRFTVRPPSIPPAAPARPGLPRPPVRRPFHTIPWPHTHPAPRPFRFRSIIPGCTGR